jgi:ABC-type transport system involved in multi-copper enzyme maturation permease subunit
MLMLLFALYGVVFGVAMIARDRDDGTLEAELSLPMARWVPGAARWTSSTAVLAIFLGYCVALFDALVGVPDAGALIRHGIAASGGAVCLGIAVVGRAGIRRGFSGPFAIGLTIATALLGMGIGLPRVGQWLPLASVLAGGDGWAPLTLSLLSGVVASALFAWRSAGT